MRSLQVRQTLGGNNRLEALGFRAEVQRIIEVTIHAKDSRSCEDSTTGIAGEGAVFIRVSVDQKPQI